MGVSTISPPAIAGILLSTLLCTNTYAQNAGATQGAGRGDHPQSGQVETGSGADATGADRASGGGGANSSVDSQSFVKRAVESNFAEIKVSELAQSKARSPEVKNFAQHMIDDHTQANSELAQLAKTKNLNVPRDSDMMHNVAMKMLQGKSGESFDQAYLKQMDKDHKKTIELFQSAADSAKMDKDLQAFAAKILPKLQQHEQLVTQVESKLPTRSASSR